MTKQQMHGPGERQGDRSKRKAIVVLCAALVEQALGRERQAWLAANLIAIALVVTSAAPSVACSSDLQNGLQVDLDGDAQWAVDFMMPVGGPSEVLRCFVGYTNIDENAVRFVFRYSAGGAKPGVVSSTHTVSFRPTAVCSRAGTTNILYVMGYTARDNVVIEKWELPSLSVGTALPVGGGAGLSFLVGDPSSISKKELWRGSSTQMLPGPVSGAVCDAYGEQLLLLVWGGAREIYALDLLDETTPLVLVLPLSGVPDLASSAFRISSLRHSTAGMIYVVDRSPSWKLDTAEDADLHSIVVMKDSGLDGIDWASEVDMMNWTVFNDLYESNGEWVRDYAVP